MPEAPTPPQPGDDNNIDVTLSMLDGEHMNSFMKELTTIRDNFESMTEKLTNLAQSFEKATKKITQAGESASRPTSASQERQEGHSSAAESNKRQEELFGRLNYADTSRGSYATDTQASVDRSVDEMGSVQRAQRELQGQAQQSSIYTPQSWGEWAGRANQHLHGKHAALGVGAAAAEGWKLLRSDTSDGASESQGQLFDMPEPESITPPAEKLGWKERLGQARNQFWRNSVALPQDAPGASDNTSGSGSAQEQATQATLPGGSGGKNTLQELLNVGLTASNFHLMRSIRSGTSDESQREYSGASFGYRQTGGDATIPGTSVGFRVPYLNPASRHMVAEDFEKLKYSAQAGLNKQQVNTIFNSGYEQGFTPQTEQATDVFRTAAGAMMKKNTAMGNDPMYLKMLGDAVKYGTTSISDFNQNMENIPLVAAKANVGLGDFMSGLQEVAQVVQQQGGNQYQAANDARQWTASTGLAPSALAKVMQSPFYSTLAYQKTGLLPFEQGLMSGPQTKATAAETVYKLADMPGFKFPDLKQKSPDGGYGVIAGSKRTEAMVAQITGLDQNEVHSMLANRKRIQSESAMEGDSRTILSELQRAGKDKGKIAQIMSKDNINPKDNVTTWAEMNKRMGEAGFSKKERADVWGAGKHDGKNQDPVVAMQDRINKMQVIEGKHASQGRGKHGKTTEIDLTDTAKKLVKIIESGALASPLNPAGLAKTAANAGEGLVNDAFGVAKSALVSSNPVISAGTKAVDAVEHLFG